MNREPQRSFFRGAEFISYDIAADRADPGYPRPIDEFTGA